MKGDAQAGGWRLVLFSFLLIFLLSTGALTCGSDSSTTATDPATGVVTVQAQISSSQAAPAAQQKLGTEFFTLETTCILTLTGQENNVVDTEQFSVDLQYTSQGIPIHGQTINAPTVDLSALNVPAGCFNLNLSCVQQGLTFPFTLIQAWEGDVQFCSGSDITVVIVTSNIFDLANNEAIQELVLTVGCPVIAFILTLEPTLCAAPNFCSGCPEEGQCVEVNEDFSFCDHPDCPPLGGEGNPRPSCESGGQDVCDALEEEGAPASGCVEADSGQMCCIAGEEAASEGLTFTGFLCTIVLPGLAESAETLCSTSTQPTEPECAAGVQPCGAGQPACPLGQICVMVVGTEAGCCSTAPGGGCPPGQASCSERGCPPGFICNPNQCCVPEGGGDVCGDGAVTGTEECDPSCAGPCLGCSVGEVCGAVGTLEGCTCTPEVGGGDFCAGCPEGNCITDLPVDFCMDSACPSLGGDGPGVSCNDPNGGVCDALAGVGAPPSICTFIVDRNCCVADCRSTPCEEGFTCACDLPPTVCSCIPGGPPPK